MAPKARIVLFSLSVGYLVLAACQVARSSTPPPTSIPITLAHSPALRSWGNRAYECAARHNQIAVYTQEIPVAELDPTRQTLTLWLGSPDLPTPPSFFAALVGWESVEFITNRANPYTTLTTEQLKNLFLGDVKNWAALGESNLSFEQPVQAWSYAEGNELRQILEATLLNQKRGYPVYLAPDPQAMLLAISTDPGAVGYVPQSWITDQDPSRSLEVQAVQVDGKLAESLRQPVIALSPEEPEGAARALLVCLQSTSTP